VNGPQRTGSASRPPPSDFRDWNEVRRFATRWMYDYNRNRPTSAMRNIVHKQRLAGRAELLVASFRKRLLRLSATSRWKWPVYL